MSGMNDKLQRLVRLNKAYGQACTDLIEATAEELPVGTILKATLGRSRITGEVVDHCRWSTIYAGSLFVRNLETGKVRRVTPHYAGHEVQIVSVPNAMNHQQEEV